MYDCECGCETRLFQTKEEKIETLKKYRKDLESEIKGVSERIKELENN